MATAHAGGLNDQLIARATGAAPSTVRDWLARRSAPTGLRAERVSELSALLDRLPRVMSANYIPVWPIKPIEALDDDKPRSPQARRTALSATWATRLASLSRGWRVVGGRRVAGACGAKRSAAVSSHRLLVPQLLGAWRPFIHTRSDSAVVASDRRRSARAASRDDDLTQRSEPEGARARQVCSGSPPKVPAQISSSGRRPAMT